MSDTQHFCMSPGWSCWMWVQCGNKTHLPPLSVFIYFVTNGSFFCHSFSPRCSGLAPPPSCPCQRQQGARVRKERWRVAPMLTALCYSFTPWEISPKGSLVYFSQFAELGCTGLSPVLGRTNFASSSSDSQWNFHLNWTPAGLIKHKF